MLAAGENRISASNKMTTKQKYSLYQFQFTWWPMEALAGRVGARERKDTENEKTKNLKKERKKKTNKKTHLKLRWFELAVSVFS